MLRSRQRTNPFYALLIAVGIAFTVTASAYFVMALRDTKPAAQGPAAGPLPHGLMEFMDQHGVNLMLAELALLAVGTCGAIGTDGWWNPAPTRPSADQTSAERELSENQR